ncbi:MAG TPA: hypothetical protein VFV57_07090 [Limnobacter sp.]|nr:hypothetical protein [Limnobacter sp.]
MGWFSNTLTSNRIQNTGTIIACRGLLSANQLILDGVDQFATEQIARGNQLSAKAFSIYGVNSQLGRELQIAVNTLNSLKSETTQRLEQLEEMCGDMTVLIQQFDLPRTSRGLNLSGKQMAHAAENMTDKALNDLSGLITNYRPKVINCIETLDKADQRLNPGSASTALLALPAMNFRSR